MLWLLIHILDFARSQHIRVDFTTRTYSLHEFAILEETIVAFVVPPEENLHFPEIWFGNQAKV